MVRVSKVSFNVRKKIILNNVNSSFHNGHLTAILGPNGAGKFTLVKCIAGTIIPSKGHIEFDGKNINNILLEQLA